MTLGWGQVPPGEWAALKTRPGADAVEPGDYEVQAEKYLGFAPKENGVGAHVIVCKVTERNATNQGKELHVRFNYDPNPQNDGRRQMNLISQQNAKQLFIATGTQEVVGGNGYIDLEATIKSVPIKKPTFVLLVTQKAGEEYQETKNFRPSPA